MKFSLFCPSRERVDLLLKCVDSAFSRAAHPEDVEFIVVMDRDDVTASRFERECPHPVRIMWVPRSDKFNRDYYNPAARIAFGKYLWVMNDECEIVTDQWDIKMERVIENFIAQVGNRDIYVGMDDSSHFNAPPGNIHGHKPDRWKEYGCCFPILTREAVEKLGCFFPEELDMWGSDVELYRIFCRAGWHPEQGSFGSRLLWVPDIKVLHKSAHNAVRENDEVGKRVAKISVRDRLTEDEMERYAIKLRTERFNHGEPMLSIICATKGRPAMMQKLLERIYATKTNVPFEVVMVVSGSEDVPEFRHDGPPVLRVIHHKIPGAVPASERAIKEARGEWVWGLNDDITIETPDWIDRAWARRFEGILACREGHQYREGEEEMRAPIIPFPFFNRSWYMWNVYPTPYFRYCQDRELCIKAQMSEEMGIVKMPEVMLRHNHDFSTDVKSTENDENAICRQRIDQYRAARPAIISVLTFRAKGSRRPLVIKRMVEQLRTLKTECVVIIRDDCSTCPEQRAYLESIYGLDGRFYVKFCPENLGPNGQHQKSFNLFLANKTPKWILLDDDLVITQKDWLDPVLKAMDQHPHLYCSARPGYGSHPHGVFMTGTHDLLKRIGGYDLKTFPFRYGECHADFTFMCQRAGLAADFPLGFDHLATFVPTAHEVNQAEFVKQRAKFDAILEDPNRLSVPHENTSLDWIRPFPKGRAVVNDAPTWLLCIVKNRLDLTRRTFESLKRTKPACVNMIVVDAGSSCDVLDYLKQEFDAGFLQKLILNKPDSLQVWQKSHAIVQAVEALRHDEYTYFGWIDNDVEVRPGWFEAANTILTVDPLQVVSLHNDRHQEAGHKTLAVRDIGGYNVKMKHSANGCFWVMRKEFFDKWGLPPVGKGFTKAGVEDWVYTLKLGGEPVPLFGIVEGFSMHLGYRDSEKKRVFGPADAHQR